MQIDTTKIISQISLNKLSFLFGQTSLSLVLAVFFVFYCFVSGVLWYHWSKYGMGRREIRVVKILFFFISLILFVFAALGISYL